MSADRDAKIARMLHWIAGTVDKDKLRNLYRNAQSKGEIDIERAALERLWTLEGIDHDDPLHRDFAVMLAAYEHALMLKHGRNVSASRTRQKLRSKGVVRCLEDWAQGDQETAGFKSLLELGFPQYTGEAVVLRHAERFNTQIVDAARARLMEHGVSEADALTRE